MAQPVRIYFLGGLGEIGRNCMVLEQDDKLMLIDCGLMFPDADMHGIDLVLPDFTFLRENADRIVGCVATHGHEDHVGGLQFLLRELSFPIYGSMVTLGLARNRIEEAGLLKKTELITVRDGERINIGPFDVEFLPVTHSVPHAHAVIVHTPQGVIVQWLALVTGLAAAVVMFLLSIPGRQLVAFGSDAWREVKKVVWPTRKESLQMTAYVFGFVFIMALFLWLTDKTLEWVFYDLILGWKK